MGGRRRPHHDHNDNDDHDDQGHHDADDHDDDGGGSLLGGRHFLEGPPLPRHLLERVGPPEPSRAPKAPRNARTKALDPRPRSLAFQEETGDPPGGGRR